MIAQVAAWKLIKGTRYEPSQIPGNVEGLRWLNEGQSVLYELAWARSALH